MNASASAEQLLIGVHPRRDLVAQPMQFGGQRYWSVKDPLSERFFQLRDEEHFVLENLSSCTTLDELQQKFERQFAPRKINPLELQRFIASLHAQGLAVGKSLGQGDVLLERQNVARRKRRLQSMTSLLAIRLRGFNADPLLSWLYPKLRWMFTRAALGVCVVLVISALLLFVAQYDAFRRRLPDFHAFFSVQNAALILLTLAGTKIVHELGHALACKHFGGHCHEMGVMFLVFTPCLYCNVSDAWLMPSKWHRIAISSAGIIVEVTLAAVALFLWWYSEPGLLNAMCLNIVFVCSVSTLLLNGNPLLRYDGYYILADWIEVPNLRQQSTMVLKSVCCRLFLGIRYGGERLSQVRRPWLLLTYGIAAVAYRFVIVFAILWFLHSVLEPQGLGVFVELLAVLLLGGMLVVPLYQFGHFLMHLIRSGSMKWRRSVVSLVVISGALAVFAFVPLPYRVKAPAVLEPSGAHAVYVTAPGRLQSSVREGDLVAANEELAVLEDLALEAELNRLDGQISVLKERLKAAQTLRTAEGGGAGDLLSLEAAIKDLEDRRARREEDQLQLVISSPVRGVVLPPRNIESKRVDDRLPTWSGRPLQPQNIGSHLQSGTMLCLVGQSQDLEAHIVIDQTDVRSVKLGQRVELMLPSVPGEVLTGRIEDISETDLEHVPPELIHGRAIAMKPDEAGEQEAANAPFVARVKLDPTHHPLTMRSIGNAKIHAEPQSLGLRMWRYLRHTFRFEL